jgi:hypothetical protein
LGKWQHGLVKVAIDVRSIQGVSRSNKQNSIRAVVWQLGLFFICICLVLGIFLSFNVSSIGYRVVAYLKAICGFLSKSHGLSFDFKIE